MDIVRMFTNLSLSISDDSGIGHNKKKPLLELDRGLASYVPRSKPKLLFAFMCKVLLG